MSQSVQWLSHTLTEPLLRQRQQQRWQPLAKRRNTSSRRPRCSLHLWANCDRDLGRFNASARHLLDDLGRRISENSGEAWETSFLYQRISIWGSASMLSFCMTVWVCGHLGDKLFPAFRYVFLSLKISAHPLRYICMWHNGIINFVIWYTAALTWCRHTSARRSA